MTDIGKPKRWRRYEPIEEPTREEPSREVEPQKEAPVAPPAPAEVPKAPVPV